MFFCDAIHEKKILLMKKIKLSDSKNFKIKYMIQK